MDSTGASIRALKKETVELKKLDLLLYDKQTSFCRQCFTAGGTVQLESELGIGSSVAIEQLMEWITSSLNSDYSCVGLFVLCDRVVSLH